MMLPSERASEWVVISTCSLTKGTLHIHSLPLKLERRHQKATDCTYSWLPKVVIWKAPVLTLLIQPRALTRARANTEHTHPPQCPQHTQPVQLLTYVLTYCKAQASNPFFSCALALHFFTSLSTLRAQSDLCPMIHPAMSLETHFWERPQRGKRGLRQNRKAPLGTTTQTKNYTSEEGVGGPNTKSVCQLRGHGQ